MVKENIKSYLQRLNSKKIVIENKYFQEDSNELLSRTSNFEKMDNIDKCPLVEKIFLCNNKKIYTEYNFNSDIKYTYLSRNNPEEIVECPSCGYTAKAKEFTMGCPYCETDFSMEVSRKKEKIRDVFVADITIFGVLLIFLAILVRADIINMDVFLMVLSIGMVIEFIIIIFQLIPLIMHKDIWHDFKTIGMNINIEKLYNDLYTELSNYYYDDKNKDYQDLVDFDILSYNQASYDKDGKDTYIILSYTIRKYYYVESRNTIKVTYNNSKVKLVRNIKQRHKTNKKFASKCKNCGSSMNFDALECEYCGSKNESTMVWMIKEIIKDAK